MSMERTRALLWIVAAIGMAAALGPLNAQQASPACRVSGRITAAGSPLPGVAITARSAGHAAHVTASEVDGRFQLALPSGSYTARIELTGFTPVERDFVMSEPCAEQTLDVQLSLTPRTPRTAATDPAAGR